MTGRVVLTDDPTRYEIKVAAEAVILIRNGKATRGKLTRHPVRMGRHPWAVAASVMETMLERGFAVDSWDDAAPIRPRVFRGKEAANPLTTHPWLAEAGTSVPYRIHSETVEGVRHITSVCWIRTGQSDPFAALGSLPTVSEQDAAQRAGLFWFQALPDTSYVYDGDWPGGGIRRWLEAQSGLLDPALRGRLGQAGVLPFNPLDQPAPFGSWIEMAAITF